MRRALALALTAALFAIGLTASATSYEHIKDRFSAIGWGGSDGSLPWAQNWVEINDDGDEKFGGVRVVSSGNCAAGNCIQITKGLIDSNLGAKRKADTSLLEELSLCYELKNVDTGIDLGLTHLLVQVNGDGEWVTLADYDLGEAFSGYFSHDGLDDFSSEDFQVRFLVTGPLLPSEVYIDNVDIQGVVVENDGGDTTTTTTTTEPTTTTTKPESTTTTRPRETTTTTTAPISTTTTAPPPTTSSTLHGPDRSTIPGVATPSTTSTTVPLAGAGDSGSTGGPGSGAGPGPEGTGIRAAARGLQATFQGDLYGEMRTVSGIDGVDLRADYNMAVEVIRATWAWVVVLGLLIAWAIVSGLDHRREDIEG